MLFDFQANAIDEMYQETNRVLKLQQNSRRHSILLSAIMGSGKTVMAAKYLEMVTQNHPDVRPVWLTIGSGDLHRQSAEKIQRYSSLKAILGHDAVLNENMQPSEVVVLNWEALNKKDGATQTFANVLMRDGERRNLPELWRNTREHGLKILLVIDESHHTAGSESSREIIELIDPALVVQLTATPDYDILRGGYMTCHTIIVPAEDVIQAGLIKKELRINADLPIKAGDVDEIEFLLEHALAKREHIAQAYAALGIGINPLCLIQLPNGDPGEEAKKTVLRYLRRRGVSTEWGNLAIWLADESVGLDGIKELNSPVDCLIFKQAVATGWDCPRASVLVKLREVKSEIFDLQVVGRILRTPNARHYGADVLDCGYIYTNAAYQLKVEGYKYIRTQRQVLKPTFQSDVLGTVLRAERIRREAVGLPDKNRLLALFDRAKKGHALVDLEAVSEIKSATLDPSAYEQGGRQVPHRSRRRRWEMSPDDVARSYRALIQQLSGGLRYRLVDMLVIRYLIEPSFPAADTEEAKQNLAVANQAKVRQIFAKFRELLRKEKPLVQEVEDFVFAPERYAAEKRTSSIARCAYEPHFESDHESEIIFEKLLEDEALPVSWWIKNGDFGPGAFSLVFKDAQGELHGFYPDYIVKFACGKIGVFELKSSDDLHPELTMLKNKALQEYCQKHGLVGGVIVVEDGQLYPDTLPDILRIVEQKSPT